MLKVILETKSTDHSGSSDAGEPMDPSPDASRLKKPILIVLHQEHSTPAQVGHTLRRQGHALDIRKPRFGDELPSTLEEHDGAVIFGGPQCANDPLEFLIRETDWISVPLREKKPFLGICLGAQMLANHLGARVFRDPYARAEIGYYAVDVHAEPINGVNWPTHFYQWHRDGFDLPADAELMVSSEQDGPYPNQAFRYDNAVAMQFHPEITYAQVNRWSNNSIRLKLPGARPRAEQLTNHLIHGPKVRHWLDAYLKDWIATGVNV